MSRTTAGRALLDELAGRAMDFGTVLDHAAWAEALDAIEREAAQQGVAEGAAQERERLLPVLAALSQSAYLIQKDGHYCDESPHSDRCGSLIWDIEKARAILADNSPSASAEPDGEPSE